jgi:hypothetical protein
MKSSIGFRSLATLLLVLTGGLAHEASAQGLERFAGLLADKGDSPLVGKVSINGVSTTTPSSGAFEVYVPFSERYVLSASAIGAVPHSEIYEGLPLGDMRLRLAPAEVFTIDPTKPVDVTDSRGGRLLLPAGALVDASGKPASGPLTLSMYSYAPATEPMLGDQGGARATGQQVALYSLGAMSAEFSDAAGNPYNLASGRRARLMLKAPPGTSNGVVPLWWYDMAQGVWREEGSVTLTDGVATGEVSHFTVWNMALQFDNPACLQLEVDPTWFANKGYDARNPLSVLAVVTSPVPRSERLDIRSTDTHVLYNLVPNSSVELRIDGKPYAFVNVGASWGGSSGRPAYPYDACKARLTLNGTSRVATLQGQLTRQHRTSHGGVTIQAIIGGTAFTTTTDATGTFSLAVPAGTGSLEASKVGYLSARRAELTATEGTLTRLPPMTLRTGDVDGSQCVDAADMALINSAISTPTSSADEPRDLDGDMRIGFSDLRLAAGNGRQCGPMPW